MNEDQKELVEYLDKKFTNIDQKFTNIDEKFVKVDGRFISLPEIFITKTDLENFRDEYRKDFSNLQTSVDIYAHKADTYFQEVVMLSNQNKRHEKWLLQIAEKLGMKLEF